MSNQTLKDWRENVATKAKSKPREDKSRTLMELLMVTATILSAIATGYGAYYSSRQYEASLAQLTASDKNLTFQTALEALLSVCKTVRQVKVSGPSNERLPDISRRTVFLSEDKLQSWLDQRPKLAALSFQAETFRDKFKIYSLWVSDDQRELVIKGADELADRLIETASEDDPEKFARAQAENLHICEQAPNLLINWFKTGREPEFTSFSYRVVPKREIEELMDQLVKAFKDSHPDQQFDQ